MASRCAPVISPVEADNKEFVIMAVSKLNWGDLSDVEMIMDVGCGIGNSCRLIAKLFPNVKKIIGIDKVDFNEISPEKIISHEKITYCVADIQDRFSLLEWDGKIERIFSLNCFNFVEDKESAFQNVHHLLKPGGEAAMFFSLTAPFYDCLEQVIEMPKWQQYKRMLKYFNDCGQGMPTCSQFKSILERVGFEYVVCETKEKCFTYPSEDLFKAHVRKKLVMLPHIPYDRTGEFKKDYFDVFERMNGRSTDGKPCMKYQLIYIFLKKN